MFIWCHQVFLMALGAETEGIFYFCLGLGHPFFCTYYHDYWRLIGEHRANEDAFSP